MGLIKPFLLRKGDTIAIISPSSPMAGHTPHRLENAIKYFKFEGYKIKEFSSTRKIKDWSAGTAKERAKDIMDAFLDKEVNAIVCAIGGSTANQVLEFLDFEKIRQNPKIFCGYSDISVLHYAFYLKCNLMTFYGPSALVQFGEFPNPLEYTVNYFHKAVSENKPFFVEASNNWTEEILNWFTKDDLKCPRKLVKNEGFKWLKEGIAKGEIIGGCLSVILNLAGTEYWPDYKGKILFLELPEGNRFDMNTPIDEVDYRLTHLKMLGVFRDIKGLIFGRPYKYSEEDFIKLQEILINHTEGYDFPLLFNADIGHTDPMMTIPIGSFVEINSKKNLFKVVK